MPAMPAMPSIPSIPGLRKAGGAEGAEGAEGAAAGEGGVAASGAVSGGEDDDKSRYIRYGCQLDNDGIIYEAAAETKKKTNAKKFMKWRWEARLYFSSLFRSSVFG